MKFGVTLFTGFLKYPNGFVELSRFSKVEFDIFGKKTKLVFCHILTKLTVNRSSSK